MVSCRSWAKYLFRKHTVFHAGYEFYCCIFVFLNIVSVYLKVRDNFLHAQSQLLPLDFLHFRGLCIKSSKVDHNCNCQDTIWAKKLFTFHPAIRADSLETSSTHVCSGVLIATTSRVQILFKMWVHLENYSGVTSQGSELMWNIRYKSSPQPHS